MGADAQGAEQPVGVDQPGAEYFRQFAACQAAQHFHLEQAVLGMHETQGAVQVGLVLCLDMRYTALVVAHRDWRLQLRESQFAIAQRLLAVDVPGAASRSGGDDHGKGGQGAFHPVILIVIAP
ncbi:hypothetical protein D9M68_848500 [compost metagenome]